MKNGSRVFIIAEVGSVHDGSFGNAMRLIDTAAECGADATKFQTHIASAETARNAPMPPYFTAEPRYEYFERTAFNLEQWTQLKKHAEEREIEFLSSPFSVKAVEILEIVGISRYKVPSGEVTNLPLLEVIAQIGKPVLLSSGMSSWAELDRAVSTILRHHNKLTMLQCTTEYPCAYGKVGLNAMLEMKKRYKLPIGLSDHTLTPFASLSAISLGASVIEKHLTFNRRMYGSDAPHSMEPKEFTELVQGIRAIETMLTSPVDKDDMSAQMRSVKAVFEKSIVALRDIPAGSVITANMLGVKKPGNGIPPARLNEIVGRRVVRDIKADTPLTEQDIEMEKLV